MKYIYHFLTRSHLARNQLVLVLLLLSPFFLMGQKVDLLTSDGTSSQFSAPQDGLRYQRQFYLITPDEMGATDLTGNATINEI